MTDSTTTIDTLKKQIIFFVQERDWQQFHSPKNLSMQILVEIAELVELFMWVENNTSVQHLETKRTQVEEEVADIAITLINFCARFNIDLSEAIENKMHLNAKKYPVEKVKGKSLKYNEY